MGSSKKGAAGGILNLNMSMQMGILVTLMVNPQLLEYSNPQKAEKSIEKQNPAYRILYSRLVANYRSIFLEFL